ncbi:hypothetical protein SARC_13676 [Sphaeroforma arctica JP610]|uniref:Uncharacterized protein n=1 Tax=Sphaeroforma arctica JP610 TaxID=667725 RepID=A0A0L0FCG5_9EUKA|nr:hypothetical protein SARC_13676 [Sphaeroforma arctica JP610]KNC73768.1 hypothetical protein SARC_13676 [Sphaeroforma arctica JP610]|eukprot:XP_014147670.1 hypothetical protein SARC_13676 [Sphaeroforma arctica JP610]
MTLLVEERDVAVKRRFGRADKCQGKLSFDYNAVCPDLSRGPCLSLCLSFYEKLDTPKRPEKNIRGYARKPCSFLVKAMFLEVVMK